MIKRVFGSEFEKIVNNKNSTGLFNIPPELGPLYAAGIKKVSGRNLLWLTGENENTDILENDLEAWLRFFGDTETQVHLHCLPWEDPYIDNDIAPGTAGEKTRLLADIEDNKKIAVISTLAGLSIRLEKKKDTGLLIRTIAVNDPVTPGQLIPVLSELGYREKTRVEAAGDYSSRGHLLDIYPAGLNYPCRIKFSQRGIESIKRFHPVSQITNETLASVQITTTVYFETTKSKNTDFLYLTELLENYLLVAVDYDSLRAEYKKLLANFDRMWKHHGEGSDWPPVSEIFTYPVEELKVFSLESREGESFCPLVKPDNRTFLHWTAIGVAWLEAVGAKVVFCCGNPQQEQIIKEKFKAAEILRPDIPVTLYFPQRDEYFISYLGRSSETSGKFGPAAGYIFDVLVRGYYVLQKTHVIGRFAGFKHLTVNGRETEFLSITYRDGANLYVPVHELDILSKYVGFEGREPVVDKIGGSTWEVKKKRGPEERGGICPGAVGFIRQTKGGFRLFF